MCLSRRTQAKRKISQKKDAGNGWAAKMVKWPGFNARGTMISLIF